MMDRTLDDQLDSMIDDNDDVDSVDDSTTARRIDADSILDSLVPQSIDWRDTVRRHPVGSVLVVGLVG